MMNVTCCGHASLNRGLLDPARSDVPHLPKKKPISTGEDALAKQPIFRPIPPNDRTTNAWTAIAWPTNIQSKTPDGKFGPAKQIDGWQDCWFLATLEAVANDKDGHKILNESIKKVNGGYHVTFVGSPDHNVFISDAELQQFLETEGGDADTRLMEKAADKIFSKRGLFKSLYLASQMKYGMNQADAEQCFQSYCQRESVRDPMLYNPMRSSTSNTVAFVMFTGMFPDYIIARRGTTLQDSDIMAYLNQHVTNDRDGAPVVISGIENPLGDFHDAGILTALWDVIRTGITRDERLRKQQRAFLITMEKWLETGDSNDLEALKSAAGNLRLGRNYSVKFVNILIRNQFNMKQEHFNLLRSGVREVLGGGPGYIGFIGHHSGTIEGINAAAGTFTYSEPRNPTLVHTGELSGLIQAIRSRQVYLTALEPTSGKDEAESSHAGQKRGRHLTQIHNQAVKDGKIDASESGPLANLMELNDGAFWQLYDSDKNGVIEGGELKAVLLRVDRWVEHSEQTQIW